MKWDFSIKDSNLSSLTLPKSSNLTTRHPKFCNKQL